jgi:hypothetical protein
MARQTDKSSAFTILALLLGLSVLAAAGILYTQTTGSGASDGTGVALAAISQAIPLHATAAVSGDSEALAKLDNDLQQLANLRRNLALPDRCLCIRVCRATHAGNADGIR